MATTTKRVPPANERRSRTRAAQTESNWQAKRGARTVRGEETLTALVNAAEMLFRRQQYDAVRVADIVELAGTSHGTFYKYFETKELIFEELVRRLEDELLGRVDSARTENRNATIKERIEEANRTYLRAFRQYGNILVILDYGTPNQPSLQATQRQFRGLFVERVQRNLLRWQEEGLIDPGVDPHYAAWALGGMVSRFAYVMFTCGEPFEEEKAVEQLTLLWFNALGLNRSPRTSRPKPASPPKTPDQPTARRGRRSSAA